MYHVLLAVDYTKHDYPRMETTLVANTSDKTDTASYCFRLH